MLFARQCRQTGNTVKGTDTGAALRIFGRPRCPAQCFLQGAFVLGLPMTVPLSTHPATTKDGEAPGLPTDKTLDCCESYRHCALAASLHAEIAGIYFHHVYNARLAAVGDFPCSVLYSSLSDPSLARYKSRLSKKLIKIFWGFPVSNDGFCAG